MVSKKKVLALAFLVVPVAAILFEFAHIKSIALRDAAIISTDYNPARTCYAQTVEASLDGKVDPILETLFYLLHGRFFYRIFTTNGELVGSNDWRFLEPEVDTDYARWVNNSTLVYPADGYRSIKASRCGESPG